MIAALAAIEYIGRITDKFFEAQMRRAACKRSASGNTMTGEFDPSSMTNFLTPAKRAIRSLLSMPPVKLTTRTRGSLIKASPTSNAEPVTTLNLPAGTENSMTLENDGP